MNYLLLFIIYYIIILFMTILITDIHTIVTRLTTGIFSLKEGVEKFYEYMWVLANHEVNPLIVPPSEHSATPLTGLAR